MPAPPDGHPGGVTMSYSRRQLLQAIALCMAARATPGLAQPTDMRRIGYLAGFKAPSPQSPVWLRDALKALGFEEGRNLALLRGFADGIPERLAPLAKQMVADRVEVIVAVSNFGIAAALAATRTIPIVMMYGIAPVEAGFIKSLARPGGNVTGFAFHTSQTAEKAFDLMLEAFPKAKRTTMLWFHSDRPGYDSYVKALSAVAQSRGIALGFVTVKDPNRLEVSLKEVEAMQPAILLVANDSLYMHANKPIADFAIERKLPTIGTIPDWVTAGGLMYFGPDENEPIARTPRFVVSLLRGARAAELPVEQPSTYLLEINAKTARAIGYTLAGSLLVRASRVVD